MPRSAVLPAALVLTGAAGPARADALDHAVTGATDTFLDKGVIGAVAVLAIVAAVLLFMALRASWQARLADAQASNRELIEVNRTAAEALRVNAEKMAQLATSVDADAKGAQDRWRTLGEVLGVLTPIQTSIAAMASTIGRIEDDTRAMAPPPSRGGQR